MRSKDADAEVLVLGAGVVGVAAAWALARRGAQVLLVDREAGVARRSSFANGAQLSYAYTDAMASPALWSQLPSMLGGRDVAFRMRASADPHFIAWGLRFLANATPSRFVGNTLSTLRLALESKAAMADLLQGHPIEFSHRVAGKLHVVFDPAARGKVEAMIARKAAFGVRQEWLDADAARAREPALAGAGDFAGAVWSPDEEVGDPWRFSEGLVAVLQARHGVQLRTGVAVARMRRSGALWRLETASGEVLHAPRVLLCAGIDSHRLLRGLGLRSPLMAVKGYSFTAPCGPAAPTVSITDTARKLVFCRLGERMRVAGLADLNDWSTDVNLARMAWLQVQARASLPEACDYDAAGAFWSGLRPVTPSSVPVIARADDGLVLDIGHGMLGWTLAMGSGERAAALLLDEP